jgi:hypothetical protein
VCVLAACGSGELLGERRRVTVSTGRVETVCVVTVSVHGALVDTGSVPPWGTWRARHAEVVGYVGVSVVVGRDKAPGQTVFDLGLRLVGRGGVEPPTFHFSGGAFVQVNGV